MNEVLEWFVTLFAIGIEELMTVLLSTSFFSQYLSRKLYILSILGYVTTKLIWLMMWYYFLNSYNVMKYLGSALIILIWLLTAYRSTISKSLFFVAAVLSYIVITDILCMTIFIPSEGILQFALQDPYAYCVIICSAKITELLGVIVIRNIIKKQELLKKSFHWTEWATTLFSLSLR